MSDLQLDSRGFIVGCPSCAQRNRVAFSAREARCGRCKSTLPSPSEPIEVPDTGAFDALVRDAHHKHATALVFSSRSAAVCPEAVPGPPLLPVGLAELIAGIRHRE